MTKPIQRDPMGRDEILAKLEEIAREGSATAARAACNDLLRLMGDDAQAEDDWSVIYGDNVTPIDRKAS